MHEPKWHVTVATVSKGTQLFESENSYFLPNPSKTPTKSVSVFLWFLIIDWSMSRTGFQYPFHLWSSDTQSLGVTCKLQPATHTPASNHTGSSCCRRDLMETRVNSVHPLFPGSPELLCAYQSLHSFFGGPVKNVRHSKMTVITASYPSDCLRNTSQYILVLQCYIREKLLSERRVHHS